MSYISLHRVKRGDKYTENKYIFSIPVSSPHALEAYIRHIRAEFYSILLFYIFLL